LPIFNPSEPLYIRKCPWKIKKKKPSSPRIIFLRNISSGVELVVIIFNLTHPTNIKIKIKKMKKQLFKKNKF